MKDFTKMFYAGYNDRESGVAYFDTKEERDRWLANEDVIPRFPYTYDEVIDLLGIAPEHAEVEPDYLNPDLMWCLPVD